MLTRIVGLVAAGALLSSCAYVDYIYGITPGYSIRLENYIAVPATPGAMVRIEPSGPDQDGDLAFQEVAAFAERALALSGFEIAGPDESPDYLIFLEYGAGDPVTVTSTKSNIQYTQTGTLTSGGGAYGPRVSTPIYGNTGGTSVASSIYTPFSMELSAVDFDDHSKTGRRQQLWKVELTTSRGLGVARNAVPYMLRGAIGYFGENEPGSHTVRIEGEDEALAMIRGELPLLIPADQAD